MRVATRVATIAIGCVALASSTACDGSDPISAIDGIRDAVRDSSYLRLEQHIAVEDLLPDITERSIQYIREDWSGTVSEDPDLDRWIDYSRQGLQACVRGEVMDDEARRCDIVDQLFMFVGIRPGEFTGADVVDRTDSVASLRLQFANPRIDTTIAVRVRAEREGDRWRIVRTENLSSVAGAVQHLQDSILRVVNDSLRREMRRRVTVRSRVDRWREVEGSPLYHVRLSVILKNTSDRPIDYAFVEVGDDATVGTLPDAVADSDTVPPLAAGDSVDLYDYNDVTWNMPCTGGRRSPDICRYEDGDRPEVEVTSIGYEDGSWFDTHDDWYSYAFREENARRNEASDGGGE